MKILIYIMIFALCATLPISALAGLTEEELKPYEKVLPKGLTPKEISEWPLRITYKEKIILELDANTYKIKLNKKDKRKLEKKKEVRLQIVGEVMITENGKKRKRLYKGGVNISIISTGDAPATVGKKKLKLSKFCSS